MTRFPRLSPVRFKLVALMMLMALTRYHSAEASAWLPDASLAVFFLAGLLLTQALMLAAFLLLALAVDYLAITYGGISSYCVSPAYLFLLPAYAALWFAGTRCAGGQQTARSLLVWLPGSVSLAFLISEYGFYAFSLYPETADWQTYSLGVLRYYPSYILPTLAYVAAFEGISGLLGKPGNRLAVSH